VTSRPGRFAASPAAKRLAAECGIDLADVTTEAPDGIITRADVERAVAAGRRAAAVVMLHGFGGDASLWDLVGAALPVGRPALSPLLPGHGGPALSDDASVEALAEALAAEPPFRGTEELHLVGHSLGAAVAILLAGRLGPRVLSLTLIAPLGFGRQIDGGFLADYLAGADEERARAALARLVGTSGRVSPALLSRTVAQMRGPSAAGLQRIAAAAFPSGRSLFDGLGALARVLAPVQTIWGREDAVIPPSDIWSMPDGVDLHLLAGAGHLVPAERAACVAALIESFATRHATGVKS
jgi:pyruvate dehydrogenase E2 component (dihydrolipoamide acetyltransferase)